MKKLASILLTLALLFSLSACGGNQTTETPKTSPNADNTTSESQSSANTPTPTVSATTPEPTLSTAGPDPEDEIILPQLGAAVEATQLGNSMGNLANGGKAATGNGWIYYKHDRMLKRIRNDGKGEAEMTKLGISSSYIQVLGDWVYYADSDGIKKIRVDGEENTLILDEDELYNEFYVMGDWIYFYSLKRDRDFGVYKIRTDGTEMTLLVATKASNISLDDGWIYYDDGSEAHRIRPDGTENTKLDLSWQTLENSHIVVDDWLVAVKVSSNSLVSFYKKQVDTGDEVELVPPGTFNYEYNVTDGWLYYGLYVGDNVTFSKVRLDGSDAETLYTGVECQGFNIVGEWIYCQSTDAFSDEFRLRTDGSGGEFLNGDPFTSAQ